MFDEMHQRMFNWYFLMVVVDMANDISMLRLNTSSQHNFVHI